MSRTKDQDRWHERGYAAGVALACAILVDVWGEEVAAEEILRATGMTTQARLKELGVDENDLERLEPVLKTISSKVKRHVNLSGAR